MKTNTISTISVCPYSNRLQPYLESFFSYMAFLPELSYNSNSSLVLPRNSRIAEYHPILPHLPIPIHQFRTQPNSNSPIPPPNSHSSIAVTNPSKQGLMYLPTAGVRSTAISIFTWEIYYFSNFTWKISTWWTGITGEHSLERIKVL